MSREISTRDGNKYIQQGRPVDGICSTGYRFRAMAFRIRKGNLEGKELATGRWLSIVLICLSGS